MAEKKREAFVDPYTKMSTKDLIQRIEDYHGDTEKAIKRREEVGEELANAVDSINDVEGKYLLEVRGEHKKYKGKPKSRMLSAEKTKEEATELIYNIALEGIKREMGDKLADFYKKNPNHIKDFLASKHVDFYNLRHEMIANRKKYGSLESYKKFKTAMASGGIEALVEINAVETELQVDSAHHDAYFSHVAEILKKKGYELNKAAPVQDVLRHHKEQLGGAFTKEYAESNDMYLKPAKK